MAYMNYAAENRSMDQDAGYTETDDRRKMRVPNYNDAEESDTPCGLWWMAHVRPVLQLLLMSCAFLIDALCKNQFDLRSLRWR